VDPILDGNRWRGLEHARITTAAAKLMRRHNYYAIGLNDALIETQAPKGSLYHYFPCGKEQLGGEAIARGAQEVPSESKTPSTTARSPLRPCAGSRAYSPETSSDPASATAARSPPSRSMPRPSHSRFLRHAWRRAMAGGTLCLPARSQRIQPRRGGGDRTLLPCVFEGGLIMARALRDRQPLHDVAEAPIRRLEPMRCRHHPLIPDVD
jgi:TetR/AcrR family transcriptional repressor of lmrAB and yxaGH operons